MKVGDVVTWTSQSGSHTKTKTGTILAVIPTGERPVVPEGYRANSKAGYGFGRDHKSYAVAVGRVVYWPRVIHLRLASEVEQEKRAKDRNDPKNVARSLSDFVNGMGNKVEDVVKELTNEHRTLQQGVTKFCVAWLAECARMHKDRNFDLRNEASAELGAKFMERLTSQERALPFI